MPVTGERVVWNHWGGCPGRHRTLIQHLQRYVYALEHTYGKVVLDAACGTGYGSMLISQTAKKVMLADYSDEALRSARKDLKYACPAEFYKADFNKDQLPQAEVVVSFESMEHLSNPDFFISNLDAEKLVFSIPINMPSKWHVTVWPTAKSIEEWVENYINLHDIWIQDGKYFVGWGTF